MSILKYFMLAILWLCLVYFAYGVRERSQFVKTSKFIVFDYSSYQLRVITFILFLTLPPGGGFLFGTISKTKENRFRF